MKDEFDWEGFLAIAKEIFQKVSKINEVGLSEEAVCRTAISRAYYFAFHVSQNYLYKNNFDFENFYGAGSHNDVINGFKKLKNRDIEKLTIILKNLRLCESGQIMILSVIQNALK